MYWYAGMSPVKWDAEVTNRVLPVSRQIFVSVLHDCFVLSKENSVLILCHPPLSKDEIYLSRRAPGKQTVFQQCSTSVMVSTEVS